MVGKAKRKRELEKRIQSLKASRRQKTIGAGRKRVRSLSVDVKR